MPKIGSRPPAAARKQLPRLAPAEQVAADISASVVGLFDRVAAILEKAQAGEEPVRGFSPLLSWSHYRVLMKVASRPERLFYGIEAEKEGWIVATLERQIHSLFFARLLKSRNKAGMLELASRGQVQKSPVDCIQEPRRLIGAALMEGR